jgi:predicted ATP-dependent endonuclease of OLD family
VHLKRVVRENIRGFQRLNFKFDHPSGKLAGWTVIPGDNASGKTALLKAIALALVGPDAARVLQPSLKGWVRERQSEGVIAVEIVAGERDRFAQDRRYERPFWSELRIEDNGEPEPSLNADFHGALVVTCGPHYG